MHRLRFVGVIVITGLALFALSAGAASASKLVLRTEKGGEVLKFGTILSAQAHFPVGNCSVYGSYHLVSNVAETDRLNIATQTGRGCQGAGYGMSGAIKEVRLSAKGFQKFALSPKVAWTVPGPCVYEFASFTGFFGFPYTFDAFSEITATGKLNKIMSLSGCPRSRSTSVWLDGGFIAYGEVL